MFLLGDITIHGRIHWRPYIGNPLSPLTSPRQSFPPPTSVRDAFISDILFESMQIFVAPTNIDINAGVTWFSEQTIGILKPIMLPTKIEANIWIRMMRPIISPHKPTPSHTSQKYECSPQHDPIHELSITLTNLQLSMESDQFGLFVNVLQTMTQAPPRTESHMDDDIIREIENESIDDLWAASIEMRRTLTVLAWEMREIEWIMAGLQGKDFISTWIQWLGGLICCSYLLYDG